MQKDLLPVVGTYAKKNRMRRFRKNAVRVMSCIVALCTAYALILPAITLENHTSCGLDEHTHSDECYAQETITTLSRLTCAYDTLDVHVHGESCMDEEGRQICGMADYIVHEHESACVDSNGVLFCQIPELKEHTHSSECYIVHELHEHGEACYEKILTCELAEDDAHQHDDQCFAVGDVPICGKEEVTEETEAELICRKAEISLHTHSDECYEYYLDENENEVSVLVCQELEVKAHSHCDECYETVEVPADSPVLICTVEEHVHNSACYAETDEESETAQSIPETEEAAPETEETTLETEETAPETEKLVLVQQALTAQIYTDETCETVAEDNMVITVTGELPEGAVIVAYPVTVDAGGEQVLFAYDITIRLADGAVWSPEDGAVVVEFASPELAEDCEGLDTQAYYLPEDGDPLPVDTTVTEDGLSFTTDHFSVYYATANARALANVEAGNTDANFALDQFYSNMTGAENGTTIKLTGDIVFDRTYVTGWNAGVTLDDGGFVHLSNNNFDTDAVAVRNYVTSAQIQAHNTVENTDGTIRYGVMPWFRDQQNYLLIAPQWSVTADGTTFDGVMLYGRIQNQVQQVKVLTQNEDGTSGYSSINGYTRIGDAPGNTIDPFEKYTLVVRRQDSEARHAMPENEVNTAWTNVAEYITLSYTLYNSKLEAVSSGSIQIEGHLYMDMDGSIGVYEEIAGLTEYDAVNTSAGSNTNNSAAFVIDNNLSIDLAGYTLTQPDGKPLFEIVPGGNLTIQDSGQTQTFSDGVTDIPNQEISYDVMTSVITDPAVGATKEDTVTRKVEYDSASANAIEATSTGGQILANGNQHVFRVTGGKLTIDGGNVLGGGGTNLAIHAISSTVTQEDGAQATYDPEVTINGGSISQFVRNGSDGGAIRIEAGTLNLFGGAITNNKSNNGGAVHASGANTVVNIGGEGKTITISNNEATINNGGAIYASNIASVNICQDVSGSNVAFSGNKTVNNGGAIYIDGTAKTNICVDGSGNNVVFTGNNANNGAAIASSSTATMDIVSAAGGETGTESKNNTVVFSGNTAMFNGGAVWMDQAASALNISSGAGSTGNKVVFTGNRANNGGAVWSENVSRVSICSDGSESNTAVFSANEAANEGGAIRVQSAEVNICSGENTQNNKVILEANTAGSGGAVYTNICREINISSAGGTGNITAISGNSAVNDGGGLFARDPNLLNICTETPGNTAVISGNTVAGNGGGIFLWTDAGSEGKCTFNIGPESGVNHDDVVISGNTATSNGGGIFTAGDPTLIMNGGYITLNEAKGADYLSAGGGGLYLAETTVANFYDGYVTGNIATKGGGMRTSRSNYVQIHVFGGHISGNIAERAEGGGICIEEGSYVYILPEEDRQVYITNNITQTPEHWGGGGVFIAYGAYGLSRQMLITNNNAGGYGGGLAGCSTGRIHLFMEDGAAIYDNTADGQNMSGDDSAKNFDRLYAHNNAVFNTHGYKDYFCALDTELSGGMLGGNPAFWSGSADGIPVVSNSVNDVLRAAYMMGLNANPTESGKAAAQEQAKVFIHNNSSHTHGGGMLINGYLITGYTDEITLGTSLLIEGEKALVDSTGKPVYPLDENGNQIPMLDDNGEIVKDSEGNTVYITMEHEQFHFTVTDVSTGAVVARGHTEEDGSIFFTEFLSFNEAGVYQYYVKENTPDDPSIIWDTSVYRLTVTVKKNQLPKIERLVGFNEITRYQYQITELTIEQYNGSKALEQVTPEEWTLISKSDPPDYDYEPTKVGITSGTTFRNFVRDETTSVTVVKQWVAKEDTHLPEYITVHLYRNGEAMEGAQYTATLNADNNWSYTWEELPTKEGDTTYSYSIVEDPLDNFVPEYTIRNDVLSTGIFVPMGENEDITIGGQYLIVTPDGKNALCVSADHSDQALNAKDVVPVTNHPEAYTIDGTTYTDYYLRSELNPSSIYTAIGGRQASPVLAAGTANQSCLLIQKKQDKDDPTVYNNLKDCNSYDYGSRFEYHDNLLIGRFEWKNDSDQYVIVYNGSKFEAILKADYDSSLDSNQPAKLYKLVEQPATGHTTIVVTNRLVDDITYTLDVTKVSGLDEEVKLIGAVFQLQDADGNAIPFIRTSATSASYEAVKPGARDTVVTTDLITDQNGKLVLKGLPAGTYTLVETDAPVGYLLAEPVVISEEDLKSNGYTCEIRVVDPPMTYTLPETGGTGTYLYTMGGLMLTMAAAIPLYSKKKRGKEDPASS